MFWASSQDFNNEVLNPVKNFFTNTVPDAVNSAWTWLTGGKSATEDPSQVVNPIHVIGGALSGVDNFFTGDRDFSRDLQKLEIANAFNAAEAQKQRDFEERLSNTAVSRRIADLKANGLNPYLAATDGASTPSGASAHSASVGGGSSGGNVGALLGAFINGAFNLAKTAQNNLVRMAVNDDYLDYRREATAYNLAFREKELSSRNPDYMEEFFNDEGKMTGGRSRFYKK